MDPIRCVIWFVILIVFGIWISIICYGPYLVFSSLQGCFPFLEPVANILLLGVMFPQKCSQWMLEDEDEEEN